MAKIIFNNHVMDYVIVNLNENRLYNLRGTWIMPNSTAFVDGDFCSDIKMRFLHHLHSQWLSSSTKRTSMSGHLLLKWRTDRTPPKMKNRQRPSKPPKPSPLPEDLKQITMPEIFPTTGGHAYHQRTNNQRGATSYRWLPP